MITFNGMPVQPTLFPDGTSQVWKINPDALATLKTAVVHWDFDHESEIIHLAQLKDLLDTYKVPVVLKMSYLPYARQDKPVSNDATFSLRTFCNFLNVLRFDSILCLDPHSSVASSLIENFTATYPIGELEHVMDETNSSLICYPDKGALTKYTKIYEPLVKDRYIYGEKVRDQATGQITKYDIINGKFAIGYHKVLIVDDIADGGATFIILAKGLKNLGAKEINLFVTHGIFSKGVQPLKEAGISRVFCAKGEAMYDSRSQNKTVFRPLL